MHRLNRLFPFAPALAAAAIVTAATQGSAQVAPDQSVKAEGTAPAPDKALFALIYRPGPEWRPGKPFREQIAIQGHFEYMKDLFAKGQIFSAGALGADHGLVLLYARDQAEADAILAADPMVQAGSFAGEVRPYMPRFLSDRPLTVTKE